ncbi:MAG: class I SAM-dependent methyltransferase [Candidatus Paceibacter sp.]|nr:class I SAM-dependent methyltransferase [Candidatus Paceibacter sp.]
MKPSLLKLKEIKTKIIVPWEGFFRGKMMKILTDKKSIIDIGGSLRISTAKGNRVNPDMKWIAEAIRQNRVDYKIMDVVPDYNPDVVGDIHNMPFADNSVDAIICMAVFEHIEDPLTAAKELYRVLKPGGYCLFQAPFLYYYHPEKGYYNDYWRFTPDVLKMMFKNFSVMETHNIRGAAASVIHLTPLGRISFFVAVGNFLDRLFKKSGSNQSSGFTAFLIK